jgi:hypothetical protein
MMHSYHFSPSWHPRKRCEKKAFPLNDVTTEGTTQSVVCRPRTVAREKKNDAKSAASMDDAMPPASHHHNDKKPRDNQQR